MEQQNQKQSQNQNQNKDQNKDQNQNKDDEWKIAFKNELSEEEIMSLEDSLSTDDIRLIRRLWA